MNACSRGVVRYATKFDHEVVGIRRGYQGLLEEDFHLNHEHSPVMTSRCVSDIAKRGGTILRSSRSEEFRTEAGQKRAAAILEKHGIDALVPIERIAVRQTITINASITAYSTAVGPSSETRKC